MTGIPPHSVSMLQRFNVRALFITLLLAVLIRACLWFAYQPVSYSDTNSYRRTALAIREDWNVDGTRTPGYPIFLIFFRPEAGGWEQRAWLGQMLLGTAVTGLLFFLGWLLTGKTWGGIVMGCAYTLNLQQVFFECNLITEALTTFLLTLTLAGFALWHSRPGNRSVALAFGIGLAAALTAIVRPLFVFLPVWMILFFLLKVEDSRLTLQFSVPRLLQITMALIPSILIVGGWIWFVHDRFGNWSMTTMGGYHMIQHTGEYFEYVPDEYAVIRDTYLKYRDAKVAATGTPTNAIWEAIPEMTQASGIGFYDLSDKLMEISVQLIRQHPDFYAKNAIEGWWMFWRAPVYWSAEAPRWPGLAAPLHKFVFVERLILFACNLAFLVLSAGTSLAWLAGRKRGGELKLGPIISSLQPAPFSVFLASAIWVCSVFQTLLDHGDNPRFLVPLQMALILWLIMLVNRLRLEKQ